MAEKVEVVQVGGGGTRVREIAKGSAEIHSIGVYKAIQTDAWTIGINAREYKLEKIEKAVKFNKEITEMFVDWCVKNGLSINYSVAAMFRRAAALFAKFGDKHAELYVNTAIPEKYRPFWGIAKEILKSKYLEVRR
jgi:hypothetical protein